MEKRDFFISYTRKDRAWAAWLAYVLKEHGYSVYLQALDIVGGDSIIGKMNEMIKNSRNFIAIWSEDYVKSAYCEAELEMAYNMKLSGKMNGVLFIRMDGQPLEPMFASQVFVNLSALKDSAPDDVLILYIMNAVRKMTGKPSNFGGETVAEASPMTQRDTNEPAVAPPSPIAQRDTNAPAVAPPVSPTPENDASVCGDFVMTHTIGATDMKYNLLLLGSSAHIGYGREVTLQWRNGSTVIRKHMHNTIKGRIDGVQLLYRENNVIEGETLRVSYDSSKRLLTLERA